MSFELDYTMKILYDHQIFTWQEFGGISRYHAELIKNLNQFSKCEPEFPNMLSNNCYLNSLKIKNTNFFQNHKFPGKVPFIDLYNKNIMKKYFKFQDFDVFHPTYYDPYFLKYLGKKNFVVTIHDMIYEIFPEYFPDTKKIREAKQLMAEKATKIIAVSNHTKSDILKYYQIDPDKIEVIYHGNYLSDISKEQNILERSEKNQYLLFVGSRAPYKNFPFLIKSIAPVLNEHQDVSILCAGGGKFSAFEKKLIIQSGLHGRVNYTDFNDNSIVGLYHDALAFVFPSLYEGFGIPILEAFACGCPVIMSNRSSLPEVGGNAACYFDPTTAESIENAVEQIISDENLRIKLRREGFERLNQFSLTKTMKKTCEFYASINQ